MNLALELEKYKKKIANVYDRRSPTYDTSDWHIRIADKLLQSAQLSPGQTVLDIATGTGLVAISAAQIVGNEGRVIGVDISGGMLEKARDKVSTLGLKNVEFQLADAEALDFPENSFDRILCSSALIWMADIPAALQLWRRLLKPSGILGFHAFAQTAFIAGVASQKAAEKQGVSITLSQPTGTAKKCEDLLKTAGFEDIKVIPDESESHYISLEKAQQMWIGRDFPAPGQFPHPLAQLSPTQLDRVQADFLAELEALNTDRGIWNDVTIFYVFGSQSDKA